jgi:hypothetical protein
MTDMTAAFAYELPPHSGAPLEAIEEAAGGEVVYLTRRGERVAAIVPPEVAAAGAAAVAALEDALDIRAAREALADPSPSIPLAEVLGCYRDDLAAYPGDDHEDR